MNDDERKRVADAMEKVLADTYTLFLKTQNYHWNVQGPDFNDLHEMFESQYNDLFTAIDDIAERIRALGVLSAGTFDRFRQVASVKEGDSSLDSDSMVKDLIASHQQVVDVLRQTHGIAQECNDPATMHFVGQRLFAHEKTLWMLRAKVV